MDLRSNFQGQIPEYIISNAISGTYQGDYAKMEGDK
jgi:hypothetical protein